MRPQSPHKSIIKKRRIPGKKREVLLYFSDFEGKYLVEERREILKKGEMSEEAKEIINELIKGPKGKLIPTLPSRTKLLGLQLGEQGVVRVDFDKALTSDHPGGSSAEIMTLYSIINSLNLNFPRIKEVQILIEGKAVESLAGHLSLRKPVSPNHDLIKGMGKKKRCKGRRCRGSA
jgi:spore germination protein GerM